MNSYEQAASQIIKAQEAIIGPLAFDQVSRVTGMKFKLNGEVEIAGNPKDVLANLVEQYSQFFGKASVEVCRDALKDVKPPIPTQQLPDILR